MRKVGKVKGLSTQVRRRGKNQRKRGRRTLMEKRHKEVNAVF